MEPYACWDAQMLQVCMLARALAYQSVRWHEYMRVRTHFCTPRCIHSYMFAQQHVFLSRASMFTR